MLSFFRPQSTSTHSGVIAQLYEYWDHVASLYNAEPTRAVRVVDIDG